MNHTTICIVLELFAFSPQYAAHVPTNPWRGSLTIPRALALTHGIRGYALIQRPIKELDQLRLNPSWKYNDLSVTQVGNYTIIENKLKEELILNKIYFRLDWICFSVKIRCEYLSLIN